MKKDIRVEGKVNNQDHDYALGHVHKNDKKGFFSMFVVMLGFTFFSASMLTGGNLGTSLSLKEFFIAVFIGNLILACYTGALAYIGSDTGFSMHLLARYSFGEKGSYLASFITSITQIGWFGVGIAMFAIPVANRFNVNLYLLVGITGILMTATAYFGHDDIFYPWYPMGTGNMLKVVHFGLRKSFININEEKEVTFIKIVFETLNQGKDLV